LAYELEQAIRNASSLAVIENLSSRIEQAQNEFTRALQTALAPSVSVNATESPADTITEEVSIELMDELDRLLREDDMKAGDALREIMPILARTLTPEVLVQLRRHIAAYDFQFALETLRAGRAQS
jgi:hemolysin activation/secretion protein